MYMYNMFITYRRISLMIQTIIYSEIYERLKSLSNLRYQQVYKY